MDTMPTRQTPWISVVVGAWVLLAATPLLSACGLGEADDPALAAAKYDERLTLIDPPARCEDKDGYELVQATGAGKAPQTRSSIAQDCMRSRSGAETRRSWRYVSP